ncbi:MAG: hypothetical protein ACK4SA_07985 [Caldilinea sp.]
MLVTGDFNVELRPLEPYAQGRYSIRLSRLSIDKTFTGDLMAARSLRRRALPARK